MCVLICKPKGVKMPAKWKLQKAFIANPHGCGCASESVYFKSLSFGSLMKRLSLISEEEACLIHFRLATHGSIRRANCHPFKRGSIYFAHNGIIDIDCRNDRTDSETAFEEVVYPAIERYGWGSREANGIIADLCGWGSKIVLLNAGDMLIYGGFLHDADGCYYSNYRFLDCYQANVHKPYKGLKI